MNPGLRGEGVESKDSEEKEMHPWIERRRRKIHGLRKEGDISK